MLFNFQGPMKGSGGARATPGPGGEEGRRIPVSGSPVDGNLEKSVFQTQRVHLYPFRTQKLSSAVAKILYGRLYGKIVQR